MHQKPTYLTSRNTVSLLLWDWTKSSMMQEDLQITKLIILIFSLLMAVFLVTWLSGQWKMCLRLSHFNNYLFIVQLLVHSRPNWLFFYKWQSHTLFLVGNIHSTKLLCKQSERWQLHVLPFQRCRRIGLSQISFAGCW